MRRSLVIGALFGQRLRNGSDAIQQRSVKALELGDRTLLAGNDVIQFQKKMFLVGEFALDVDQPRFAHDSLRSMSLLRFDDISLDFGDQTILSAAEFSIETGERVCLIGRNGAGKSTTLKLITGEIEPDRGEIVRASDLVISQLAQALPDAHDQKVRDVVRSGLSGMEQLLATYRQRSAKTLDRDGMLELEALHAKIDAHDGWHLDQRVEETMTELGLPAEQSMRELSGGWRRRVALAQALVQKPSLLLLDEPTNHLDIATIRWLEDRIYSYPGAVLFITHDRAFLQRLATRIVEIDRGKLTSWPGDYDKYLSRKEKSLEDEAVANARFDKKLAQEEEWIRQGIKARRTRNEGRARALMQMREERAQRVSRGNTARIHIEEAERSGRKVIRARNLSYGYGDESLIENFSVRIMRGDRIGLIGNNGVGKTTLLRLLLGELEPRSGTLKHGTNLEIGYFDQLRQTLELDKSVAHNVGDGRMYIKINGKDRHIVGYLKGFLFSPKRAMTPVKALSGGERNRVILAKLFTQPANLLVLDEPTNDLDIETLEVLEQRLCEFTGTLIVVSHDREFLDNVVTSTIVFEENGRIQEYVGGYSDWRRQGHRLAETDNPFAAERRPRAAAERSRSRKPTKLSYKDQRELDALPAEIARIEATVAELQQTLANPDVYSGPQEQVQITLRDLAAQQALLEARIERWEALETLQADLQSGT